MPVFDEIKSVGPDIFWTQYDGWVRRENENAAVLALAKAGAPIKEIVRRTGTSRGIVRRIVRGGRTDVFRSRISSLDPFTRQLETEGDGGCRNGSELWRRLKAAGFVGSWRVVTESTTRRAVTPTPRRLRRARTRRLRRAALPG